MKNSEVLSRFFLHLCKEIPNLLQILTFEAFLALLIHDPVFIGLTTAILCSAYLGTRNVLYDHEHDDPKIRNKFLWAHIIVSLPLGYLAGHIAYIIVKTVA